MIESLTRNLDMDMLKQKRLQNEKIKMIKYYDMKMKSDLLKDFVVDMAKIEDTFKEKAKKE